MFPRRFLAFAFTSLFVASATAPLVGASTEPTPNGDVVINGAFADARALGHPLKFYCDANNPSPVAGPGGECAHANQFVVYDWTTPVEDAAQVTLVEGGVRLQGNVFVQQHFNGSDAPDRQMQVFHVTVQGVSAIASTNNLAIEIRADGDGDGDIDSYRKLVTLGTSATTVDVTAAALGIPAGAHATRSVRLWASAGADLVLSRVSVYATNGIESRNLNIVPAGDDVLSPLDAAALLNAGDDGKYSFLVGMASDNGDFLPTLDASVCLYTGEQAIADRGFPANFPVACEDAYLKADSPSITKTRAGDAWRFDIDARAVQPTTQFPSFALYATVKVDASYDIETPGASSEFKSGYFNALRLAADQLGAGVSQEYFAPTPLFIDADADGKPDYVSTQDMDGYSVIITPQLATVTPGLAVVTTDMVGDYLFDVQVYKYDGATGAPMDLPGAISLGLFDAASVVAGGSADATPFWRTGDEGSELERIDAKTWRVHVPSSEVPVSTPMGAWAFYNVGEGKSTSVFGRSTSSTDFFSAARNAVKEFAVADAMRAQMTPILLDSASTTRDATFVIRMDADSDDLTPLDGTVIAGDKGDGSITFEYAMVVPDGRTVRPDGHGLAIYDAAGVASDDVQPGTRALAHAEWTGVGALQSDGWYRVDVPVSAFADAKGAIGAWGYTDKTVGAGVTLSRSGWYNLLKPAAAALSTSAAEKALYEPTPILLLDAKLGIPTTLASALAGAGTDLVSLHNPLVNPGFEADLLVEGHHDAADNTGGVMTSPPWFLRLDDKGTGQPTNPASTHRVASGKGRLADHALQVSYNRLDQGKSLMLGQILGSAEGGDALVWRGATGVELDVQLVGATDVRLTANVRYLDATGETRLVASTKLVTTSGTWTRASFPLAVPADAKLLGVYVVMDAPQSTTLYLDNIVLEGARTALGETRSDLTDGFAVVIEPAAMTGATQNLVRGVDGDYYVYTVTVIDYTNGAPATLDLDGVARSFALRTQDLQIGGGILMTLRSRTDAFVALVPAGSEPAAMAVPWAFVDAGPQYATLGAPAINQPASGHYNPVKNALAGAPFADQLDYAATPVRFGTAVGATESAQQSIRLAAVSGGYVAIVAATSPYAETTTLTVSSPGGPSTSYAVTLTKDAGDVVPGLLLTQGDLAVSTLTTADTRFTRGATLIAGSPIAGFEVCRPGFEMCLEDGALSGELLTLHSTSVSPTGEPLTHVWRFGDGDAATEADDTTTHRFLTPGARTVNLTVQTPSGKKATYEKVVVVNNRAPSITGLDITPTPAYVDSIVRVRARAGDSDGGSLAYTWRIDGVNVAGATQASLLLTPSVLENATGLAELEKREYVVSVTVSDGQGGVNTSQASFTVQDKPTTVTRPRFSVDGLPGAAYALAGETLLVSVLVSDGDDAVTSVALDYVTPLGTGTLPLVQDGAVWTGTLPATSIGAYSATARASVGMDLRATSPEGTFETRADSAPVVTLAGATATDIGETLSYTVSAVDPDGRGIAGVVLTGAQIVSSNGGSFDVRFDTIGITTLTANATDLSGSVGSAVRAVLVDDVINVTMSMYKAAQNATEGHLVKILVTDAYGAPIAGASVVVEDFYDALPQSLETRTVRTDAEGVVIVHMRAEAVFLGLPMSRTVVATATAASHPDAPVQDDETASASFAIRNTAGPLGGLALP